MQVPNQRAKDRVPPRKFSTLVKQLVVELDRDPNLYPESNTVEVRVPLPHHPLPCWLAVG